MNRISFLFLAVILLPSCYIVRAYKFRKLELEDVHRMPSVAIDAGPPNFSFAKASMSPQWLQDTLDRVLPYTQTAAFLVIRRDTILYERYFNGFDSTSQLPSFSVAKSFVATLVSIAQAEGAIHSFDDPVTRYLPELRKTDQAYDRITLRHLLDMRSGLDFNEGMYNLKDAAIRLGFRPNLRRHALNVKVEKEPGGEFRYQSINTELLALALEAATGKKISDYLEEKLWKPLGAEGPATWNVDSKKHQQEIAFAALNARARDFARLGRLMLRGGNWEGRQVLQPDWVASIVHPDSVRLSGGYKNQWWNEYRNGTPMIVAQGILGQYITILPHKDLIFIRLGHWGEGPRMRARSLFRYLAGRL